MRYSLLASTAIILAGLPIAARADGLQTGRIIETGGGTSGGLAANGSGNALSFTGAGGATWTGSALAALAQAAIPSSAEGAGGGVAMLDGNKLLLTSQIPFGTADGQVAPASLIRSLQSTTNGAVQAGSASTPGGDVSFTTAIVNGAKIGVQAMLQTIATGTVSLTTTLNGTANALLQLGGYSGGTLISSLGDSFATTLANWGGSNYYLNMHGADGTAADDDAAVVKAFTYARVHPYTHVIFPMGAFPMLATAGQTYLIPIDTTLEGSSQYASDITWNDANQGDIPASYTQGCIAYVTANPGAYCQYGLFSNDRSQLGTGRARNIAVHRLRFTGSWGIDGTAATFAPKGYGGQSLELDSVDGVDIADSVWEYSRSFGPYVNGSSEVRVHDNVVNYSTADGIPVWASSDVTIYNNHVQHDNDDCISGHDSVYGGAWISRRDYNIYGNTCWDTSAIDVASPRYAVIFDNTFVAPRGNAISVDTAPANTNGTTQGDSSTIGLIIANNLITDLVNRTVVDSYNGNNTYITVDGYSARVGTDKLIPGQVGYAGMSHGQDPAPEFFANSAAAVTPIGESHAIVIANNLLGTFLPSFDGTLKDSSGNARFPNWESFGMGPLVSNSGPQNPSVSAATAFNSSPGISLFGTLRDVTISDNHFDGLGAALLFGNGIFNDIHVLKNTFFNISGRAIDIENNGLNNIDISYNDFDGDPYVLSGCRGGSGNWSSAACAVALWINPGSGPGLSFTYNSIKNSGSDTNADPTDPAPGYRFKGNVDYADLWSLTAYGPTGIDAEFNLNAGMRLAHINEGFDLVPMHGDPTQSNFGQLYSAPVEAAVAMPFTGFWVPGQTVKALTPALGGASSWTRATISNGGGEPTLQPTNNASGIDWFAAYLNGTPPSPALVQSASTRNSSSATSTTLTFPNAVGAADEVILLAVGGNPFTPTVPSGCTELVGANLGGYSAAQNQVYEAWACAPGTAGPYTIGGLGNGTGAIITGYEVSNYQGADVVGAPVAQNGTALTVPVVGGANFLRFGIVEWDTPATTATASPSSIAPTCYANSGDNGYHYGCSYVVPGSIPPGSFTLTTGATVSLPTYVQVEIYAAPSVTYQTAGYTLTSTDCGKTVEYDGAAAATFVVPQLPLYCRASVRQGQGAGALTVNNAAGEALGIYNSTNGTSNTPSTTAGSNSITLGGPFDTKTIEQGMPALAVVSSGLGH